MCEEKHPSEAFHTNFVFPTFDSRNKFLNLIEPINEQR